ncbi:hypothetical protein WMF11_05750 [Sorangium sp. So ce295]|jgi:hypothetical protein|uniref:hypothetical protein n=1 Tax=Sorangium sp. So ce295 TaxID=3133295 RepID=UPI003F5F351D
MCATTQTTGAAPSSHEVKIQSSTWWTSTPATTPRAGVRLDSAELRIGWVDIKGPELA